MRELQSNQALIVAKFRPKGCYRAVNRSNIKALILLE
jgi:hypothetical protein